MDFLHEMYEEVNEGGAYDLSEAFDTVDYHIITIKLKSLGIKESTISWFTSYLSD